MAFIDGTVVNVALPQMQERLDAVERLRRLYAYRRSRFSARFDGSAGGIEERSVAYQRLTRELLNAQREALLSMRDEERISDEAMHRVEHELDLEESRLEI